MTCPGKLRDTKATTDDQKSLRANPSLGSRECQTRMVCENQYLSGNSAIMSDSSGIILHINWPALSEIQLVDLILKTQDATEHILKVLFLHDDAMINNA